jgi:hypothetical protein
MHSCYGHIEDVHMTFWKCSDFFRKFFQHVFNGRQLLSEINSFHTFSLTLFKPYTVVMDTLRMCMWLLRSVHRHYLKNLHEVRLSNFSSMFWIDDIQRHQLTTVSIWINILEQPGPFCSWIDFLKEDTCKEVVKTKVVIFSYFYFRKVPVHKMNSFLSSIQD